MLTFNFNFMNRIANFKRRYFNVMHSWETMVSGVALHNIATNAYEITYNLNILCHIIGYLNALDFPTVHFLKIDVYFSLNATTIH